MNFKIKPLVWAHDGARSVLADCTVLKDGRFFVAVVRTPIDGDFFNQNRWYGPKRTKHFTARLDADEYHNALALEMVKALVDGVTP